MDLTSTADSSLLQLSTSQASIFPTALDFLREVPDRYLGFQRSLVDQIDRLDSDVTTIDIRACDSRASFRCGVGSILEVFCGLVHEDDIPLDASLSSPTEMFVVFTKLCCCYPFLKPLLFLQTYLDSLLSFHLYRATFSFHIGLSFS